MMLPLDAQIEAILFFKTDAMSIRKLSELLNVNKELVEEALTQLKVKLEGRGVSLTRHGDEVMLTCAKEASLLIEKLAKDELEGELSRASVETLSIVLYRGSVTKSEIDYIRGVNASFILRALQIRGLVERTQNPKDGRAFIYKPTIELYNFLGITKKEELPDYEKLMKELDLLSREESQNEKDSMAVSS